MPAGRSRTAPPGQPAAVEKQVEGRHQGDENAEKALHHGRRDLKSFPGLAEELPGRPHQVEAQGMAGYGLSEEVDHRATKELGEDVLEDFRTVAGQVPGLREQGRGEEGGGGADNAQEYGVKAADDQRSGQFKPVAGGFNERVKHVSQE
jgi:hypothetical protein